MKTIYWLEGGLYTVIAGLTPVSAALATSTPLTPRFGLVLGVACIIAAATALKGYLSGNPPPSSTPAAPATTPVSPINPIKP